MAEVAFLDRIESYLGAADLTPAPTTVGPIAPVAVGEVPALVLALERAERRGSGLGSGADTITGVLAVSAQIDLSDSTLPGDPSFNLWNEVARILTLPHGGLVRRDGTSGSFGATDFELRVDGVVWPLSGGPPAGQRVRIRPTPGQIDFGQAPPVDAIIDIDYHVGQWERRFVQLAGDLLIDAWAANAADVLTLSNGALRALLAPSARRDVDGLLAIDSRALGPVEPGDFVGSRRRALRFRFEYQHRIDEPASSGGIIRDVRIITHLRDVSVDAQGAVVERFVTERS